MSVVAGVALGLDAEGNWHGPVPPGPDWAQVNTGARGGKIWRKRGGGVTPAQKPPPTAAAQRHPVGEYATPPPATPPATPPTTAAEVTRAAARNPILGKAVGGGEGRQLQLEKAQKHVGELLRASGLSPEKQFEYGARAAEVFDRMSEASLRRVRQHAREIKFHADIGAMNDSFKGKYDFGGGDRTVLGVYSASELTMHLDGGFDAAGTYAHEFMHSVDGPRHEISEDPDWVFAWQEEIVNRRLVSSYAHTRAREGLAEFGRMLWVGHRGDQGELEATFPKCMAALRKYGVV